MSGKQDTINKLDHAQVAGLITNQVIFKNKRVEKSKWVFQIGRGKGGVPIKKRNPEHWAVYFSLKRSANNMEAAAGALARLRAFKVDFPSFMLLVPDNNASLDHLNQTPIKGRELIVFMDKKIGDRDAVFTPQQYAEIISDIWSAFIEAGVEFFELPVPPSVKKISLNDETVSFPGFYASKKAGRDPLIEYIPRARNKFQEKPVIIIRPGVEEAESKEIFVTPEDKKIWEVEVFEWWGEYRKLIHQQSVNKPDSQPSTQSGDQVDLKKKFEKIRPKLLQIFFEMKPIYLSMDKLAALIDFDLNKMQELHDSFEDLLRRDQVLRQGSVYRADVKVSSPLNREQALYEVGSYIRCLLDEQSQAQASVQQSQSVVAVDYPALIAAAEKLRDQILKREAVDLGSVSDPRLAKIAKAHASHQKSSQHQPGR